MPRAKLESACPAGLASEPSGWRFGPPSALYSNVPVTTPEQRNAGAPARMTDAEYAERMAAIGAQSGAPVASASPEAGLAPIATGRIVPSRQPSGNSQGEAQGTTPQPYLEG